MRKIGLIIAGLLFFSLVHAQNLDSLYAKDLIKPGTEAPDMLIDSLSNTRLKDFRGRYVVLHFWASWCPDCRKDMPEMNKLYEEYASDSVIFIHLSYDTDRTAWQEYVKQSEMGGLQLSELKKMKESVSAQAFGVKWIPSIVVIDQDGKVALATVVTERLASYLEALR